MTLTREQIETMRGVLQGYWEKAGHSPEAPNALCDAAIRGLAGPLDGDLAEMIAYLDRQAYSLECCDTTNTYEEAQKIRGWIRALKGRSMPHEPTDAMIQAMAQCYDSTWAYPRDCGINEDWARKSYAAARDVFIKRRAATPSPLTKEK